MAYFLPLSKKKEDLLNIEMTHISYSIIIKHNFIFITILEEFTSRTQGYFSQRVTILQNVCFPKTCRNSMTVKC